MNNAVTMLFFFVFVCRQGKLNVAELLLLLLLLIYTSLTGFQRAKNFITVRHVFSITVSCIMIYNSQNDKQFQ
jgi:hypothetical protein